MRSASRRRNGASFSAGWRSPSATGRWRRTTCSARKIVITGDTAPSDEIVEAAWGANVLVTEATFLDEERDRAQETLHQTALQAADIARRGEVVLLALTHLSSRYFGPEVAREARELFPETVVPRDFDVIEVPFPERGGAQLIREGARHRRTPDAVSSGAQ